MSPPIWEVVAAAAVVQMEKKEGHLFLKLITKRIHLALRVTMTRGIKKVIRNSIMRVRVLIQVILRVQSVLKTTINIVFMIAKR